MSTTELRAAVARARLLLAQHPHIAAISDEEEIGDGVALTLHVRTNLPFAWAAVGASPNGVRISEPVRTYFSSSYPIYAPTFYLRQDFDRSLAHVMPGDPNELPQPCIFEGSTTELLHHAGLLAVVDHLVSWLEDAALERLINSEQGWEPVRRDALHHTVTMDADHLRSLVTDPGAYALLNFIYVGDHNATYGEIQTSSALTAIMNVNDTVQAAPESGAGRSIALVIWPDEKLNGQPLVTDRYLPETIRDLRSLEERAASYGLNTQLEKALEHLRQYLEAYRGEPVPVCIVFCVRRPIHLIGSTSNIEILAYIAYTGAPLFGAGPTTPTLPALQRYAISTGLLQRLSGDDPARQTLSLVLLGCGSLGSKIGVHLARRGMAPTDVIDNRYLSPHNAARHALVPENRIQLAWLRSKANGLASAINGFAVNARPHHQDIIRAMQTAATLAALVPEDTHVLLNTTATHAVTEALAAAPVTLPRIIDAALLANGTIGTMTLEGMNRNPNIGDLLSETYAILGRGPNAARIFSPHAKPVEVGQGCASLTMTMSDARISMFAAPMSEAIAAWAIDGLPPEGIAMLGRLQGLSLTWESRRIRPSTVVAVEGSPLIVRLGVRAHRAISTDVARYSKVETGGVLMGRYSEPALTFYVTDVLPAPPDSKRASTLFELGTEGLNEAIDAYAAPTNFTLYCLGTWHSHLRAEGASGTDRGTATLLGQSRAVPFVMLIHTPRGYRAIPAAQQT